MKRRMFGLAFLFVTVCAQEPTVKIGNLTIIGKYGDNYSEFYGIPYAKPPVGERRFRKPEPLDGWFDKNDTFEAKSFGASCLEFPTPDWDQQDEDCLFLNVFVSTKPADNSSGYPVMVWIHGGGFQTGSSNVYLGTYVTFYGNVILVTLNYRLGIFGFLSTGDKNGPGNYGLYDQRLAIQWVRDNIRYFGGDTERVTIAGESAGAISTILHGISPQSRGLFQRVIAQSGSPIIPFIDTERNNLQDAQGLGNVLNCRDSTTLKLVECLRNKTAREFDPDIFSASVNLDSSFLPCVDGDFVKFNPKLITISSDTVVKDAIEFFRSLDFLSGVNLYEGVVFLTSGALGAIFQQSSTITNEAFSNIYLPPILRNIYGKETTPGIIQMISAQYTNWTDPTDYRLPLIELLGDSNFGAPCIETALLHSTSTSSKTFVYQFTPKPSQHVIPLTPPWLPGAGHGDELPYTFGRVFLNSSYEWEVKLSKQMITYWGNFIQNGDPNAADQEAPVWPEYNEDSQKYLEFGMNLSNSSVKQHLLAKEHNFWYRVLPDLIKGTNIPSQEPNCEVSGATSWNFENCFGLLFIVMMVISQM